jgi:shikimate dehydrogenase
VLGAGGAARGAVWALRQAGADVAVWNRTPERAEQLANDLDVTATTEVDPAGCELVVNATSIGLDASLSDESALAALGLEGKDSPATVCDLVYRAGGAATPLANWAARGGARFVDGLEILVRQGARSFHIWTGEDAPLDVMRGAARA